MRQKTRLKGAFIKRYRRKEFSTKDPDPPSPPLTLFLTEGVDSTPHLNIENYKLISESDGPNFLETISCYQILVKKTVINRGSSPQMPLKRGAIEKWTLTTAYDSQFLLSKIARQMFSVKIFNIWNLPTILISYWHIFNNPTLTMCLNPPNYAYSKQMENIICIRISRMHHAPSPSPPTIPAQV